MTRKLATIQRIKDLFPIEGADRIELALVQGWQVVTQKGTHQVGDLVVFYEIDSFLPASDVRYASFSDRFINWGDKHGMRLKTIKLRKQLSQGLIMPVREFPEITDHMSWNTSERVSLDVTELLKIEKWEPLEKENTSQGPGSSQGRKFPAFIRKTDQERIQNYGALVERELDTEFEVTVKKDGSSMSVFRVNPGSKYYEDAKLLVNGKMSLWQKIKAFFIRYEDEPVLGICSRNVMLPLSGTSNFHVAAQPVLEALNYNEGSVAIQGEVVAPTIQGNYEKVSDVEFHIFDVFNIDKQEYMLPADRVSYTGVAFAPEKAPHATVVARGKLRDIIGYKDGDDVVKLCLAYASGPGDNPGVMREGVVFKAMNRDFSFKAVSNEYLLSTGK